jgi:SpoVK/Ycf46/Vps4 family AAA+-type ATPase
MASIVLNPGVKEMLLDDARDFLKSEKVSRVFISLPFLFFIITQLLFPLLVSTHKLTFKLFRTTNHLERLDPALSRSGRMDVWVEFKNASRWQAEALFRNSFSCEEDDEIEGQQQQQENLDSFHLDNNIEIQLVRADEQEQEQEQQELLKSKKSNRRVYNVLIH